MDVNVSSDVGDIYRSMRPLFTKGDVEGLARVRQVGRELGHYGITEDSAVYMHALEHGYDPEQMTVDEWRARASELVNEEDHVAALGNCLRYGRLSPFGEGLDERARYFLHIYPGLMGSIYERVEELRLKQGHEKESSEQIPSESMLAESLVRLMAKAATAGEREGARRRVLDALSNVFYRCLGNCLHIGWFDIRLLALEEASGNHGAVIRAYRPVVERLLDEGQEERAKTIAEMAGIGLSLPEPRPKVTSTSNFGLDPPIMSFRSDLVGRRD
ncbi:MAG: hypothetical protein HYW25_00465 [Candidatus Aenigmarchaeota archaeon]|nr:hypothetical protein [Candidatus Aenigmarchaeota archaeon]